jgi:hypothetical protein
MVGFTLAGACYNDQRIPSQLLPDKFLRDGERRFHYNWRVQTPFAKFSIHV